MPRVEPFQIQILEFITEILAELFFGISGETAQLPNQRGSFPRIVRQFLGPEQNGRQNGQDDEFIAVDACNAHGEPPRNVELGQTKAVGIPGLARLGAGLAAKILVGVATVQLDGLLLGPLQILVVLAQD